MRELEELDTTTEELDITTETEEAKELEETTDLVDFVARLDEEERLAKEEFPYDISFCSRGRGPLYQLIFSCKTCYQETGELKGVCYGCSVSCHTCHDLVELNHKRNFTCDCRESCKLLSSSKMQDSLAQNRYEKVDNFKGIFCYCKMEHSDKETRIMVQCILCEDWFHDNCIQEKEIPKEGEFDDFLCLDCLKTDLFSEFNLDNNDYDISLTCCQKPKKRKRENLDLVLSKGWFLPLQWRKKLCRCNACLSNMNEKGYAFLLEKEILFNPPADPTIDQSTLQLGMRALNRIDRVVALDSIQKFNSLKDALSIYLQSFAGISHSFDSNLTFLTIIIKATRKTVTKADIANFFETHSKI